MVRVSVRRPDDVLAELGVSKVGDCWYSSK